MSELSRALKNALASEYRERATELHTWADPLDDEQFWMNPYAYGNSVGHLVLHLTGNLSYYIGAQIAGTGYVRHRDLEFTETRRPSKAEALGKLDEAIAMVVTTIAKQDEKGWTLPYTGEREPQSKDRLTIFLRCAVHFYSHVAQISYLSRELRKK